MKIKKIKINFLLFIGLIILSFSVFAAAEENSSSNKNIFEDYDQDGLSNDEEKSYGTNPDNPDTDGDGYSDEIEIRSGYDPLKHAPGDKIISENNQKEEVAGTSDEKKTEEKENLTEEISKQVADLISKSESENEAVDIEDLDSIVSMTTDQVLTFDDLPKIEKETIKIKKQDYSKLSEEDRKAKEKEDASQYLSAVTYIAMTNSPYQISSKEDVESFSSEFLSQLENFSSNFDDSYFQDLAEKGESSLEQLNDLEVPENLLNFHIKGLQLTNYAIGLKDTAKIEKDDPAQSIVNLSKIKNLLDLSEDFYQESSKIFIEMGITGLPISFE